MVELPFTKPLRCAVYTRKSSDEGLEQEFNSLHAQREACEAYIASQKHEGWQLIPTAYDDGGFSGGSMNRPALQQLLADIAEKRIDVVVVYKVDRLSRSLADFAKMVEVFDAHGVSFVSVTQAFSTTTSMGRLTLNVLLSFAQFEREVTGERIRDKIAASKAKGMWMGGVPPLGYDAVDRKLVVNAAEAEHVRTLFQLYRKLKAVDDVAEQAFALGIRSKQRVMPDGEVSGGLRILRGALYGILSNPIYMGDIPHKGTRYPGLHEAIVPVALFDEVQKILTSNRRRKKLGSKASEPSVLAGLIVDIKGHKLQATHTQKGSKRYRYYAASPKTGVDLRIPAYAIERVVVQNLAELLGSPERVTGLLLSGSNPDLSGLEAVVVRTGELAKALSTAKGSHLRALLLDLLDRVIVAPSAVTLRLKLSAIGASGSCADIVAAAKLERRRQELTLVLPGADDATRHDASLLRAIAQGRRWFVEITSGKAKTLTAIAAREHVTASFVGKMLDLALLAPDIIALAVEGKQPPHMTAAWLRAQCPLPASWEQQRAVLLS